MRAATFLLIAAAALGMVVAGAWAPARADEPKPERPQPTAEQQKRLDLMKSRGVEASLTILPIRIGGEPMDGASEPMAGFRTRLTEVVGLFLEQKGLKNIELPKTAFEPKARVDLQDLAAALAEFLKQHPVATQYVLYAELRVDGLRAVVADKEGALVWSDEVTAGEEPFGKGPPEPMAVCLALAGRVGPRLGLNAETAKAAKPGKIAAIMAERSGLPPENERSPMAGRQAAMKKAIPAAAVVVYSPRVRGAEKATEPGDAATLAKALTAVGLCKAAPAKEPLLLKAPQIDSNEMRVLWDLAREFRDYVKKNPVDADYVLYADYRFHPQHWEQGYVHFVVCDRKGDWVLAELLNSHHTAYQSIKPTSKEACDKILVKRLHWVLTGVPFEPASTPSKK